MAEDRDGGSENPLYNAVSTDDNFYLGNIIAHPLLSQCSDFNVAKPQSCQSSRYLPTLGNPYSTLQSKTCNIPCV